MLSQGLTVKILYFRRGDIYYMSRLKQFHFVWCDAWHMIDSGYDIILETSDKGEVSLQCLVNLKPQKISLTDRENDFIDSLERCNIQTWNEKQYGNYNFEDGSMWDLVVAYDNVTVRSKGMNGYPKEFVLFIDTLCDMWGLSDSRIKSGENIHTRAFTKGTVIKAY